MRPVYSILLLAARARGCEGGERVHLWWPRSRWKAHRQPSGHWPFSDRRRRHESVRPWSFL